MKKCLYILIVIIFLISCGSNKTDNATQSNNVDTTNNATADSTVSFFPVTSFLEGQMLQFDSMAVTPLFIHTMHEKSDSQWIKREQLKPLLQTFLTPEITETNLIKYFKETKFNDQTVGAVTFTYDPIKALPDSITLSNWNVYVDPKKGSVTKVYIVKHLRSNNQNITQQLTWQTGQFAQITEILNKPDGSSEILKQDKYIWNLN